MYAISAEYPNDRLWAEVWNLCVAHDRHYGRESHFKNQFEMLKKMARDAVWARVITVRGRFGRLLGVGVVRLKCSCLWLEASLIEPGTPGFLMHALILEQLRSMLRDDRSVVQVTVVLQRHLEPGSVVHTVGDMLYSRACNAIPVHEKSFHLLHILLEHRGLDIVIKNLYNAQTHSRVA